MKQRSVICPLPGQLKCPQKRHHLPKILRSPQKPDMYSTASERTWQRKKIRNPYRNHLLFIHPGISFCATARKGPPNMPNSWPLPQYLLQYPLVPFATEMISGIKKQRSPSQANKILKSPESGTPGMRSTDGHTNASSYCHLRNHNDACRAFLRAFSAAHAFLQIHLRRNSSQNFNRIPRANLYAAAAGNAVLLFHNSFFAVFFLLT